MKSIRPYNKRMQPDRQAILHIGNGNLIYWNTKAAVFDFSKEAIE